MKKKILILGLIIVVCISSFVVYFACSSNAGDTVESREVLLDKAIAPGENWNIVKETEIEGFIISAAYSTDNKATLAVFEPEAKGKYKFSTSVNRQSDEIIIGGAVINGDWYDLVWFNGAQTEYAEIVYTINGKENKTQKFDTTDMDIIYNKNPEKEYEMSVCYYDSEGNKYE